VVAYNKAVGTPNSTVRHVFAFQIGQRFVVTDPTYRTGEFGLAIVTNADYKMLTGFTS
jgi:hypothetical protein